MIDETKQYSSAGYTLGKATKHAISPVDLTATLSLPNGITVKFATLTMLSVSEHRDKFPVSILSSVGPVGFTLGHRMIAGSLVFSVFDRAAFTHALDPTLSYAKYPDQKSRQGGTPKLVLMDLTPDELPPFDIHMVYANSEGTIVYEGLRGVTLLDRGALRSMELMQIQESYSFMATRWIPLQPLDTWINSINTDVYQDKVNIANNIASLSATPSPNTATLLNKSPVSNVSYTNYYAYVYAISNGNYLSGVKIINSYDNTVATTDSNAASLVTLKVPAASPVPGTIGFTLTAQATTARQANGTRVHTTGASSPVTATNNVNTAPILILDVTAPSVTTASNGTVS